MTKMKLLIGDGMFYLLNNGEVVKHQSNNSLVGVNIRKYPHKYATLGIYISITLLTNQTEKQ